MTVAEYIINYLSEIGVTHIFGVSGGFCMYLIDAVSKHPDIEFVHCIHEHSAVVAAMGYAQYKNELGVVLVTGGPGACNCINGVAGAYIDSVPLLVISGQDKTFRLKNKERSKGINEVDIFSILENWIGVCSANNQGKKDHSFKEIMNKLVTHATTNRKGPAWIEIPLDVQCEEVNG
jgi:acetolactate synthase-1/2/3 large subunit